MGTFTAHALIGVAHRYHEGILPTHFLYLSENGRPAWILVRHDPLETTAPERLATWIPSVDDMLDDGMMMIAAHVARSEGVRDALGEATVNSRDLLGLLDDVSPDALEAARSAARSTFFDGIKMVLTVLEESSIRTQLTSLDAYELDAVVCVPQEASSE